MPKKIIIFLVVSVFIFLNGGSSTARTEEAQIIPALQRNPSIEERVSLEEASLFYKPTFMKIPEQVLTLLPQPLTISSTPLVDHREFCQTYDVYDHNPLTGFIDDWGFCVPGLVTNEVWFTKSLDYVYGTAVFYSPGMMKATARWRGMYNEAYRGEYLGGVATTSPADIGETLWIRREGHEWEGPYLVVDCSRRADVYTHIAINQQVVEVDFNTALRWGMVSTNWERGSDNNVVYTVHKYKEPFVEVYYGNEKPNKDIQKYETPVYYSKYWLDKIVEFQRDEIEPSPIFFRNGLNPLWDLRDGLGRRCFTTVCEGVEE